MHPLLAHSRFLLIALLTVSCVSDNTVAPVAPVSAQYQDPEINPNDTYVAFDARVTVDDTVFFSQPTTDPATGQTVTSIALPEAGDIDFRVESGYDAQGVLRANLVGNWSTSADSTSTRIPDSYHLLLSNGQLSEYSATGALCNSRGAVSFSTK